MAVATAAVVGAVATVAATGVGIAQSQGAMGGGGGGQQQPKFGQVPEDPQDRAMKDYYARALVANAQAQYPAFNEYLRSGGDPSKAQFQLTMPGMKPSEAAALGFTGTRGEPIPYATPESVAAAGGRLSREQIMYLAQERRREARARGQEPGPWAGRVGKLGGRIGRLEKRLEERFYPTPEVEPREAKIESRLERLRGKRETLLNPPSVKE